MRGHLNDVINGALTRWCGGEVTQHGISMEGCAATAYRFLVMWFS